MKVINTWIFNTTTKYMGRTVTGVLFIYECENNLWVKLENGLLESITELEALKYLRPATFKGFIDLDHAGTGSAPITDTLTTEHDAN